MGDQSPQSTVSLDLNLEPVVHPHQDDDDTHTMSFEDWLLGSMSEVVSHRPTTRQRFPSVWRHIRVPVGGRNATLGLTGDDALATDERNAADHDGDEPPSHELIKTDENGDKHVGNEIVDKEDAEKSNGDESSFFDCNICLELASEPVVTCCGHLFCWPCLYRWLFVHSNAKECPICKGEVTMKTITPIYSRGNRTHATEVVDSSVKIPSRPQANRIESWRQFIQRSVLNMPMFEMIRRFDNRFDPTHDTGTNNPQEVPSNSLLNRIFTSRGMRSGQDTPPDAAVDTLHSSPTDSETGGTFIESYFNDHPDERNQEQHPLMEDRHSMSSIAAVIQSESQTTDTAAETDSRVSVSTVRRRCESSTSRVSDVDSGESRSQRRRLQ